MLDFVRRYIRGGLGEAQRGHEWVSVYARAAENEKDGKDGKVED